MAFFNRAPMTRKSLTILSALASSSFSVIAKAGDYLTPSANDGPVVVQMDNGGYVNQYRAVTELYRSQGRRVMLHECHSACTLALSLPPSQVCVFPDAVLKFHKAYDPKTKVADENASAQLMSSYPQTVQDEIKRRGGLKSTCTTLTGWDLINLGVADCNMNQRPADQRRRHMRTANP